MPVDVSAGIPARREREGKEGLAFPKRYGDYMSNMMESLNLMPRKVARNRPLLPCNEPVASYSSYLTLVSGGRCRSRTGVRL